MYDVQPIAGALGAEIHGVDLRDSIASEQYTELRRLLVEYQVIFFSRTIN